VAPERDVPGAISPGDRQARGSAQHVHPGARAAAAGAGAAIQPEDRRVRAPDVHRGRRADLPGPAQGLPDVGVATPRGHPAGPRHRERAELDRAEEGGLAAVLMPPAAAGSRAGRPLVIAHRGASGYEYENSPAAFRDAAPRGADAVELDIHATLDGALFVHHDETVGPTHIARSTAAQVGALRLPSGEAV